MSSSSVLISNTFYDSQSGLHIAVPGSDGFQLHKANISSSESATKKYLQVLEKEGFSSFSCNLDGDSLQSISDMLATMAHASVVASIPASSLNIVDNYRQNNRISDSLLQKLLQLEMSLPLSDILNDSKHRDKLNAFEKCTLSTKRCNLLLDLAQICPQQQRGELLPTWSIVDAVAILCDKGSSVVDLKLCCRGDYLHEIVGESIHYYYYLIMLYIYLCCRQFHVCLSCYYYYYYYYYYFCKLSNCYFYYLYY